MIYQVCCVFDLASAAYMRPMFVAARGQALRSFTDEVNRRADDNVMFHHPEDFQLFYIGEWNDSDGFFNLVSPLERLCCAVDVKVPA